MQQRVKIQMFGVFGGGAGREYRCGADISGLTNGPAEPGPGGPCLGADETGSQAGLSMHDTAGCGCWAPLTECCCSQTEP